MGRIRIGAFLVVAACGAMTIGCGSGVQTKVIAVKPDPVGEARSMLQAYAAGQPVSSEAAGYDDLVTRVKAVDSAKGESFASFVDETRKSPAGVSQRAKKLLESF